MPRNVTVTSVSIPITDLPAVDARAKALGFSRSNYLYRCAMNEIEANQPFVLRPSETKPAKTQRKGKLP